MMFFSTKDYDYLKQELMNKIPHSEDGKLTRKNFPDGERYLKIDSSVKNQDVCIVGGTQTDSNTLEVFDLGCAIAKYGAKSITFIVPYFGYSTMERSVKDGEVVGAKTRARLLSAIPQTPEGNRIVLIDLHSEGIPYYFEGNVRVFHLYAKEAVLSMMTDLANGQDIVLGSTDAGRGKWVESLAHDFGCMPAFVYKQRLSGSQTKVTGINADVKGKHVVIYDDMIRTGGSLIKAAEAYKNAGATKISAITTHAVLPNYKENGTEVNSIDKLVKSKLFDKICVTNTHPKSQDLLGLDEVKVYSVSDMIVMFLN